MILVTGGYCQGKHMFAQSLTEDGTLDIVTGIEEELRQTVAEGRDWQEYIKGLTENKKDAILILREMGCGIVPIEKEERILRDISGKAGQILAKNAVEVYRVICGIGTRIK